MKDLMLTDRALWDLVQMENTKQIMKWGIQNRTCFEWMTYIAEEVGELAEAISEHAYRGGRSGRVAVEAIQAATLCLKVAEMYLELEHEGGRDDGRNQDRGHDPGQSGNQVGMGHRMETDPRI